MKILLDASTTAPLAWFLRGHEVVRCDQNVRYQQNFAGRKLALVILSSNHWPTLRRIAARIATAVDFVQTGQIVRVDVAML
jgi:hypothetical protein